MLQLQLKRTREQRAASLVPAAPCVFPFCFSLCCITVAVPPLCLICTAWIRMVSGCAEMEGRAAAREGHSGSRFVCSLALALPSPVFFFQWLLQNSTLPWRRALLRAAEEVPPQPWMTISSTSTQATLLPSGARSSLEREWDRRLAPDMEGECSERRRTARGRRAVLLIRATRAIVSTPPLPHPSPRMSTSPSPALSISPPTAAP